jgi:hypothetical protein
MILFRSTILARHDTNHIFLSDQQTGLCTSCFLRHLLAKPINITFTALVFLVVLYVVPGLRSALYVFDSSPLPRPQAN